MTKSNHDQADEQLLADEKILGARRELTPKQVMTQTGVDYEMLINYWQALGLPVSGSSEPIFTQDDAHALKDMSDLANNEDFETRTIISLVRSVGHTTERLALWQAEALVEHMAVRYELDDVSARLMVLDRISSLSAILEYQLVHAWRRQLAALMSRWTGEFSNSRGQVIDNKTLPLPRAVGFADIVSFTTKTAQMHSAQLSEFVSNFESAARDVVTAAGGRVVKTIGDAVLFIADDLNLGANVALGLAKASTDLANRELPQVRVSLVWGRVLSRFGDVFGPSVNLAARLTDEAPPGQVLIDELTAEHLVTNDSFKLQQQPTLRLTGIGDVKPSILEFA